MLIHLCYELLIITIVLKAVDSNLDAPWPPMDRDDQGDPVDGADEATHCAERWKSSAAEHEKHALDIYDTTGLFASACHHGFILKACEMVQSGEL
jgi:Kyakuja-Dileera-Zisupton transposase